MAFLSKENKQSILIYSESSNVGKACETLIASMDTPIRCIDIDSETLSDMIWLEITTMMNVDLGGLLNPEVSPALQHLGTEHNTVGDWLRLINQKPYILQYPIAIDGTVVKQIKSEEEVLQFYNGLLGTARTKINKKAV